MKSAGIPWGSFYQYFNDKEDIYLHMLDEILKERQVIDPNPEVIDLDADFFDVLIQKIRASLKFGRVKPENTQIGIMMEMDNCEFMNKLRATSSEKYKKCSSAI